MNIFFTNPNPDLAAIDLCDVHNRKMVVEGFQMLSTAYHVFGQGSSVEGLYKESYKNHPSNVWVRQSKAHYDWLYRHTMALGEIFEMSRNKAHKSIEKLGDVLAEAPEGIPDKGWLSNPPQCMPEEFQSDDTCKSYQKYLTAKLEEWTMRERPIKYTWLLDKPTWIGK